MNAILAIAIAVLTSLFIREIHLGVRFSICLVFAASCALLAFVGNLAPHRIAESELVKLGQVPTVEWIKGALATRDEVHGQIIFWLLPLAVLFVLCVYLFCEIGSKRCQDR